MLFRVPVRCGARRGRLPAPWALAALAASGQCLAAAWLAPDGRGRGQAAFVHVPLPNAHTATPRHRAVPQTMPCAGHNLPRQLLGRLVWPLISKAGFSDEASVGQRQPVASKGSPAGRDARDSCLSGFPPCVPTHFCHEEPRALAIHQALADPFIHHCVKSPLSPFSPGDTEAQRS